MLVSPSSRHDSPRQALRDVEWKEEAEASTVTSDRIQLYPRRAGERCADKRPSAKVGSEAAASDATTMRRRIGDVARRVGTGVLATGQNPG